MMIRRSAAAVLAAAALVASGVVSGCTGSPVPGIECTFKIQNVHRSSGSTTLMDVKATGACTKTVSEVGIKIGYQKEISGQWQNVTNSFTWRYYNNVAANKVLTFMSANGTRCVSGVYRGVASDGYIIYNGTKVPAYQLGYGPDSTVTC